jgi:hypothetical protein
MNPPQSPLAKDLAIAVRALEEGLTNKCPAAVHLAKKELQAVAEAIDAQAEELESAKTKEVAK